MREGVFFFRSFYEVGQKMTPKDRLAFYDALLGYAFEDIEPTTLKGLPEIGFISAKPVLDADKQKYINGQKAAVFGKLGGRPKKENNPEGFPKNNPEGFEKLKGKENPLNNKNNNKNIKQEQESISMEEKEIYIKFFFRNFINPAKEVRRYYAWGDSGGWVKQSGRPITDKISYAGFWKPEQEGKRFDPVALNILRLAYDRARSEKAYEAADAVFCIGKDTIVGDKVCLYGGTEADKAVPYLMAAANDFGLTLEFKPLAV